MTGVVAPRRTADHQPATDHREGPDVAARALAARPAGVTRPSPEGIAAAGRALAAGRARRDALPPRQAAEEAYEPGGPTVAELEQLIRAQRGEATPLAS